MNIDSPGADGLALRFDREVFGAAGLETNLRARGASGVGFASAGGLSSNGSDLLSDLFSDGDFGGVLTDGRFFFSGMPVESSHQWVDGINLRGFSIFTVELHGPTAASKIRR